MGRSQTPEFKPETAKSLLRYAILAPSSHNTQPWRFHIGQSAIAVYADRHRALPVNDPHDRELTISCGCALMNLRSAAAHAGFTATPVILPDPADKDLLANVALETSAPPSPAEAKLFGAIERRRTYRKPFESRSIPQAIMQELAGAAGEEGAWLAVVDSKQNRQEVAALVAEGDAIQWSDPHWRRELSAWMRPRRRGDGLTVPALMAPVARLVVRSFDMGKGLGDKDKQLAVGSPVLAILATRDDSVGDWLTAGQALERVLLQAQRRGLQASYLNQPLQVASLRPKLQSLLEPPGYPQILLRLGFPKGELPASARRGLQDVIEAE